MTEINNYLRKSPEIKIAVIGQQILRPFREPVFLLGIGIGIGIL